MVGRIHAIRVSEFKDRIEDTRIAKLFIVKLNEWDEDWKYSTPYLFDILNALYEQAKDEFKYGS